MSDPTVTLRPATPVDYEAARIAHHAAYRDLVVAAYGRWDEAEQDGYFRDSWDPATFEMLLWDGRPCGHMAVEDRGDHLYVEELVVLPDFQNRGIGTAFLRTIQERARRRGLPVRLQTQHLNRAQHLYRRVGFQDYGRTDRHVLLAWSSVT